MTTNDMRTIILATTALTGAGCTDLLDIGSDSAGLGVVDVYGQQFTWQVPEPCATFLHRRAYDERARIVTYDANLGGHELSVTYFIDETATLPLGVELAQEGVSLASLWASAEVLEVRDADGEVALRVAGYTAGSGTTESLASLAVSSQALGLLKCALPMRPDLGYVPSFVRNLRDSNAPDGVGVVGSSADRPALLPDWNSAVSVLGAWVRQGSCLTSHDGLLGWNCPCFSILDPIAGLITGDCM